jgi:tRNA dimethylallyltransferase
VPEPLKDADPKPLIRELLTDLADGTPLREGELDRVDHLLATIACHSVVRAGDVLGRPEALALLGQLDAVDLRSHCPTDGRCCCACRWAKSRDASAVPDSAPRRRRVSSRCWVRRRRGRARSGWRWPSAVGGEIVACDSQQVYIGMDIGTAKPTADERRRVPHHALDLVRPDELFHAARWAAGGARRDRGHRRARPAADRRRGHRPVLPRAGDGLFEAPPPDDGIRARHRAQAAADGVEALHARLAAVDPDAAAAILVRDLVRISRALEVYEQTGVPITTLRRRAAPPADLAPTVLLFDPPLATLRARITARVEQMIAAGFLDEVRALRAAGYGPALKPLQALGYSSSAPCCDGTMSLADAVAETVQATFAYARRQRTWFRKQEAARRFEAEPVIEEALTLASGA